MKVVNNPIKNGLSLGGFWRTWENGSKKKFPGLQRNKHAMNMNGNKQYQLIWKLLLIGGDSEGLEGPKGFQENHVSKRTPTYPWVAYPRHPQTPKWKEFLHKLLVGNLGYVPGVCWNILRMLNPAITGKKWNIPHTWRPAARWTAFFRLNNKACQWHKFLDLQMENLENYTNDQNRWFLSHRIHVWYIDLHLPSKSTKCQMYVNIPYMDPMGVESKLYFGSRSFTYDWYRELGLARPRLNLFRSGWPLVCFLCFQGFVCLIFCLSTVQPLESTIDNKRSLSKFRTIAHTIHGCRS